MAELHTIVKATEYGDSHINSSYLVGASIASNDYQTSSILWDFYNIQFQIEHGNICPCLVEEQ